MNQPRKRRQRRVKGGAKERINVRTTPEMYNRVADAAEAAGLSMPRFLIESALRESAEGWSLREQRWWAERLDTVETRLIRIGVNLNQMATAANATGRLPESVWYSLKYCDETLEKLRRVLEKIGPKGRS